MKTCMLCKYYNQCGDPERTEPCNGYDSNYKFERKQGTSIYVLSYKNKNHKGETMTVELNRCEPDNSSKKSLPNLWKKHGYMDRVLESYWILSVYIYDEDGCWGRYNPQTKPYTRYDGKGKCVESRYVLDFDWVFEATQENAMKLLNKVERRFLKGEK